MPTISGYIRNPKITRFSAAGITAVGAAALALTVVPGSANAGEHSNAAAKSLPAQPTAFSAQAPSGSHGQAPQVALPSAQQGTLDSNVQHANDAIAAQKSAAEAKQKAGEARQAKAEAADKAADKSQAEKQAKQDRANQAKTEAASRSASRPQVKSYPNNLDGWIREARAIMQQHHIKGSYEGIKRNIIRESGGNPNAMNGWDINAQKGTPSKGLLQVIQPTFDQYHVKGTSDKLTDPVANIVAACNYAQAKYGSMDNVNSAY
jgi:hypothetical protein